MDRIRIIGGKPLKGKIPISGAKNAALPLLAASLLTDEKLTLGNVPHLADIATMANLLGQHGVSLSLNGAHPKSGTTGRTIELKADKITSITAPYDLVRKMRASIVVLGPLLARCGEAKVSLPGGCAIGTRPVDLHIGALERLGAEVTLDQGYIHARAPQGLKGGEIVFPMVTVTGTENVMMAAALAKGETKIINAAREPEVADLARCLTAMGAEIEGIGTDKLRIQGKDRLHGARHNVIPDRIEAGTFAIAAAITNGDVELLGAKLEHIHTVVRLLGDAGVAVEETAQGLRVRRANGTVQGVDMMTEPFPGFPTDLQAQLMALMCVAEGASMITETIFENRFMHVPELRRMGASITVHNASAMIRGVKQLAGAPVMATDLRASVSLALAGLAAEGETILNRVYHLDRGYERLEDKLSACGADIERIRDEGHHMTGKLLKLKAKDAEDVQVISAILQDAIVPVCDMIYRAEEKDFVMVVQRFCRETKSGQGGDGCFERKRSAVHVAGVTGAQLQGVDQSRAGAMLDLLAVIPEKGSLQFIFAGGGKIRLQLGEWLLILEDFGEPWPAVCEPCHEEGSGVRVQGSGKNA